MPETIHVAVIIVAYNGRAFLPACLQSVFDSDDGDLIRHVVVVDNASSDGSADFVAAHFPEAHLCRLSRNTGFAAGNNTGVEYVGLHQPGVKYIVLLNQDTVVASGWLVALVNHLQSHPRTAAVQAKLLLDPKRCTFNSAGNESHFLGFGFTTAFNEPDTGQHDSVRDIDFPSGAACAVRADCLGDLCQPDVFDPAFYNYLEDADLGWKMRSRGFVCQYVPASVVWHKYTFKDDYRNYLALERNRLWLILTYYKKRTLVLLLPALIVMEFGQFVFATSHGVLRQKFRSYIAVFGPAGFSHTLARRRRAQHRRTVGDASLAAHFTGRIRFGALQSPLVKYVANPVLGTYWRVVRKLIFW